MASTNTKIKQINGLTDTKDLNDWENDFVKSIYERTGGGTTPAQLTDRQLENVEKIWKKHFAG
jgi:hypothetical protein